MEKKMSKKNIIFIVLIALLTIMFLLFIRSCKKDTEGEYEIVGNFNISYGTVLNNREIKVIHNGKEVIAQLDDSNVNYDKLGTYTVTIIYKDDNGNEQKIEKEIKIIDDKAPNIVLKGSKDIKIEENKEYKEFGYEVSDNYDHREDIGIEIKGTVDVSKPGTYQITYIAVDKSGNKSEVTRTIIVEQKKEEVKLVGVTTLQLNGTSTVYIDYPMSYVELGAVAIDTVDKDISKNIKISSNVNTNKIGTYKVTYTVTNSANIVTNATRTVIVRDVENPTISLIGDSDITLEIRTPYIEQGIVANDNYDTNLTYTTSGDVDINTVGVYTLTYKVKDSSSNTASVDRTIRVVETKYLVLFNSGGSSVETQIIKKGGFISSPAAPTRSGYTFSYWYKAGTDGTIPFDFTNTKVEEDIVLAAKWNAQTVGYTVEIWMEKPNFYGTPTPGNTADYNYITSIQLYGRAGEKPDLNIDSLPNDIANLFAGTTNILRYSTPQYIENKVLLGNGTTTISLYAARKVYTYEFNLGTTTTRTMTIDGTTYRGGASSARYSISVKYESEISYVFPLQGLFASFSTGFSSWSRPSILTWKDTSGLASLRKYVDEGMLSQDGKTMKYIFTANWDATGTSYAYRYFAEILPGQNVGELPTITYGGKQYVLMSEYNQNYQGALGAKALGGLTVVNSTYLPYVYNSSTNTYTSGSATGAHRCFFYNRNSYTLSFNMKTPNGETVAPISSSTLLFDEQLSSYKPSPDPVVQSGNYRFAGWYYDSNYKTEVSFENSRMLNNNITVFAKWESTENIITFLDKKGGNEVGRQGVGSGGYIIDNTAKYLQLDVNDFAIGKGRFAGWYYDIAGYSLKWEFEVHVDDDYTLYAVWETD